MKLWPFSKKPKDVEPDCETECGKRDLAAALERQQEALDEKAKSNEEREHAIDELSRSVAREQTKTMTEFSLTPEQLLQIRKKLGVEGG